MTYKGNIILPVKLDMSFKMALLLQLVTIDCSGVRTPPLLRETLAFVGDIEHTSHKSPRTGRKEPFVWKSNKSRH
jgi:hypothetical protein